MRKRTLLISLLLLVSIGYGLYRESLNKPEDVFVAFEAADIKINEVYSLYSEADYGQIPVGEAGLHFSAVWQDHIYSGWVISYSSAHLAKLVVSESTRISKTWYFGTPATTFLHNNLVLFVTGGLPPEKASEIEAALQTISDR